MRTQLSQVLDEARRLQQVSGCVTLVVVSDDPAFLAASAEWSLKGRLLTWSNKLLAVTRRPLQDLPHLYTSFSKMNAMLITVDAAGASPRCSMYVHLPYSSTVLQVASWRSPRGLSFTSGLPLFPDKFYRFLLKPTLKVTAEEFPPHVVVTAAEGRGKPGQRVIFSGAMTQILEVLAHSLNFSYTILRPPDGSFGTKLANGTATGMVGMVGRKVSRMTKNKEYIKKKVSIYSRNMGEYVVTIIILNPPQKT
ncbi:glutamate receptor ionotropic, delta-1-like [Panulirus ornatus]|uniref:glutamate receptor ionotropic, delta-1-like n=1 Tax=Panulirus ornatus TaxID=150431 RepID=UPI003A860A49